jgi:hypothetical protein
MLHPGGPRASAISPTDVLVGREPISGVVDWAKAPVLASIVSSERDVAPTGAGHRVTNSRAHRIRWRSARADGGVGREGGEMGRVGSWFVAIGVGVVCAACEGKNGADPKGTAAAPAASTLAPSTSDPAARAVTYAMEPDGKTDIDMPGPDEHIKARTGATAGRFDLDLTNLPNSRGEVKVDLTTLTMYHWDDADKNQAQSEHARTWLEVVVGTKTNEDNRWAVFAIRSVDNLSAIDVTKLSAAREGEDDVRTVTMTLHGELLIHGLKKDKAANVEVKLHYPPGAAPDAKPSSITVKSREPMRVTLADHDVKPRDPVGKLMQAKFSLLGTKVANWADVSVDLRARPAQ